MGHGPIFPARCHQNFSSVAALAALDPQVEEEKGNFHGPPCLLLAECQSDLIPEKVHLEGCFLLCFLNLFQTQ